MSGRDRPISSRGFSICCVIEYDIEIAALMILLSPRDVQETSCQQERDPLVVEKPFIGMFYQMIGVLQIRSKSKTPNSIPALPHHSNYINKL
jgi:hypothetical protein